MLADNDRLMTALFFAILLHGIVILGITFDNEIFNRPGSNELEVVLIEGDGSELAPEDAQYYASQNQIGSGNTDEDIEAVAAQSSADPFANLGELDGQDIQKREVVVDEAMRQYLASRNSYRDSVLIQTKPNTLSSERRMTARLMLQGEAAVAPVDDDAPQSMVNNNNERNLVVSIDAKETNVANYIGSWRGKVERIGTLNYPQDLLEKNATRSPVLEVSIAKSGIIRKAKIIRSSGSVLTDQAALRILRLSSPFNPFPKELSKKTDTLTFVYEWHFSKGTGKASI